MNPITHFDASVGVGRAFVATSHDECRDQEDKLRTWEWDELRRTATRHASTSGIVRKAIEDREKRLSIPAGRCTFCGSSDTQLSEVPCHAIQLAHLATPDSTA